MKTGIRIEDEGSDSIFVQDLISGNIAIYLPSTEIILSEDQLSKLYQEIRKFYGDV